MALPIKASCSPDTRRYHQFSKEGGAMVFMPCWKEHELLMAGKVLRKLSENSTGSAADYFNDVDYSDNAIQARFKQFGEIFRHVLPIDQHSLKTSTEKQAEKLRSRKADPLRVLAVLPIIERANECRRTSHYLMQYDVDEKTFDYPQLKIASLYVAKQILSNLSKKCLAKTVNNLYQMFQ
ncbi:MAG: hypothetical protein K2Q09_10465, partial [Phycisphaerales bacterium]|nr:hypothetical protein [Phycisphaerales bacterium]